MRRKIQPMLLALLIACRNVSDAPTPDSLEIDANPTQDISLITPICDHWLWPLRDGATWEYQYTGADGRQQTYTLVSSIEQDGVHLTFGTLSSIMNCVDGNISGLPPMMLGSGHPLLEGTIGLNPKGTFLPSQDIVSMNVPWDLEVDAGGTITLGPEDFPIVSGKIVISSYPFPMEPIATTTGTWTALPIQQTTYYEISIQSTDGTQKQVLISTITQQYFVEGIGLVHADYLGGYVSSEHAIFNRILEAGASLQLLSYSIP